MESEKTENKKYTRENDNRHNVKENSKRVHSTAARAPHDRIVKK